MAEDARGERFADDNCFGFDYSDFTLISASHLLVMSDTAAVACIFSCLTDLLTNVVLVTCK
jgi:hypothetical protein